MTLHGDTSSLVKLNVCEEGTAEIRALVARASAVVTSAIAFVEMRSALARLRRERRLTPRAYRAAREQLDLDWPGVVRARCDSSRVVRPFAAERAG